MPVLVSLTTIPLSEREKPFCSARLSRNECMPCRVPGYGTFVAILPPCIQPARNYIVAVQRLPDRNCNSSGKEAKSRPVSSIASDSPVQCSKPASNSSQLLDIHHHRGTSSNSTATVANEPNNKFQPRETFIKRESSSICQCTIHHPPINIPSDRLR